MDSFFIRFFGEKRGIALFAVKLLNLKMGSSGNFLTVTADDQMNADWEDKQEQTEIEERGGAGRKIYFLRSDLVGFGRISRETEGRGRRPDSDERLKWGGI